MADDTTGGAGGSFFDEVGDALGKALDDTGGGTATSAADSIDWPNLGGGDAGTESGRGHGHVWDEEMPDDLPGLTPGIMPDFDVDKINASNAEARQKAIDDGLDPNTANIIYPEIDPNDPDRIN